MKLFNKTSHFINSFIIVLIAVVCAVYYYYKDIEKSFIDKIENGLKSISSLKVHQIEQWKNERLGDASLYYQNEDFSMHLRKYLESKNDIDSRTKVKVWLNKLRNAYEYSKISIYNTSFDEILSVSKGEITDSKDQIKSLIESQKENTPQFTDFFKNPYNDKVYIAIAYPIYSDIKYNKLLGYLFMQIDPNEYLYPFLIYWPGNEKTGETLIIKKEKDSVIFINNILFLPNSAMNLRISLDKKEVPSVQAALGYQGLIIGKDYRGIDVVAYVRPVVCFPWFIVTKVDSSEILEPLRTQQKLIITLTLFLVSFFAVVLRYLWKRQRTKYFIEQYETEKALREKQELYKTLINSLPQRILFKDTDSRYVSCNYEHAKYLGILPHEIVGKTDYDFFSKEEADSYIKEDNKVIMTKKPLFLEEEVVEHGKIKTFYMIKLPVFDNDNKIIGILVIFEDITEQRRKENLLKKLNRVYSVLSNVNQSIVRIKEKKKLLNEICKIGVEYGNFLFTCIGFLSEDKNQVEIFSTAYFKNCFVREDYLKEIILSEKYGVKKQITQMNYYVFSSETLRDDPFLFKYFVECNIHSISIFPFKYNKTQIGFICFCAFEYDFFVEEEIKLLKELSADLGYALEFLSQEEELIQNYTKIKELYDRLEFSERLAHIAAWEYGLKTEKLVMSKEGFNIFGLDENEKGEIEIEKIENIISEKEKIKELFDILFKDNKVDFEFEIFLENKKEKKVLYIVAELVKDNKGNPHKIIGFIQDVTKLRKTEKELLESRNMFESIANTSPALLWMSGLDKGCTWFNDVWLNFTGKSLQEQLGDGWVKCVHPDDVEKCLSTYFDAFEKKETFEMEYRLRRYDGEYRWIIDNGSPIFDINNNFIGYLGSCIDITERKKAEEEIKILNAELESRIKIRTRELEELNLELQNQIEERIQIEQEIRKYADEVNDLYNNAPCGYHSLDKEGLIIRINDTELKWIGYSREEVVNKLHFTDIISEKSKKVFEKNFKEFLNRGWVNNLEFDVIKKDGSILPVMVNATAVRDENGNFIMSRSTMFDITEIRKSREIIELLNKDLAKRANELEIAYKELESFSYSISHDLKAPLRAIEGYAKMLLEDYSKNLDAEGLRFLNVICENTQRMNNLIVSILALAKVSKTNLNMVLVDMTSMVKKIFYELTDEEKRAKINFKVDDLHNTLADSVLIRQVWVNLILNALKFTKNKENPIIEIGSYLTDNSVVYYVKDNGVGFDNEYAHRLFVSFQRLHNENEYEGSGIGLAIVERIILRHNGKVWAEGKVNNGATFYFELPYTNENNL